MVGVAGLEEQAVGTQLGLGDVVHALVVQVALLGVGEESVLLRAVEIWNRLCVQLINFYVNILRVFVIFQRTEAYNLS